MTAMGGPLLFANPNNWSQQIIVGDPNDPNIPAGWIQQWTSGGEIDPITTQDGDGRPVPAFGFGAFSGGFPPYGSPGDDVSRPTFP
jgi:hypothetical protein